MHAMVCRKGKAHAPQLELLACVMGKYPLYILTFTYYVPTHFTAVGSHNLPLPSFRVPVWLPDLSPLYFFSSLHSAGFVFICYLMDSFTNYEAIVIFYSGLIAKGLHFTFIDSRNKHSLSKSKMVFHCCCYLICTTF